MKTLSTWLILLSGVYDLLLGVALAATAPHADAAQQAVWASLVTLAAMLIFCGLILLWAARDLAARGPVVAWQGLVRLVVAAAIFHAIGQGYLSGDQASMSRVAAIIDVAVALLYYGVLIGIWRWSPIDLLLGRRRAETLP